MKCLKDGPAELTVIGMHLIWVAAVALLLVWHTQAPAKHVGAPQDLQWARVNPAEQQHLDGPRARGGRGVSADRRR
jgi:hypothetical protein